MNQTHPEMFIVLKRIHKPKDRLVVLRNVSYNDPDLRKEIDALVGPSYSLLERISMRGVGSPRLLISSASERVLELLERDHNINFCNIEIRPRGIIFRFRSKLDTYGFLIPYYRMTVFKGKSNEMTFYCGEQFIRLNTEEKVAQRFLNRVLERRSKLLEDFGGPNG